MHCENLNIVVHQEKNGAVRKALCNKCPKVIFLFGPKGGGEWLTWLKWRCRARISGCPFGESASLSFGRAALSCGAEVLMRGDKSKSRRGR